MIQPNLISILSSSSACIGFLRSAGPKGFTAARAAAWVPTEAEPALYRNELKADLTALSFPNLACCVCVSPIPPAGRNMEIK
jgi:hypothetical protein